SLLTLMAGSVREPAQKFPALGRPAPLSVTRTGSVRKAIKSGGRTWPGGSKTRLHKSQAPQETRLYQSQAPQETRLYQSQAPVETLHQRPPPQRPINARVTLLCGNPRR